MGASQAISRGTSIHDDDEPEPELAPSLDVVDDVGSFACAYCVSPTEGEKMVVNVWVHVYAKAQVAAPAVLSMAQVNTHTHTHTHTHTRTEALFLTGGYLGPACASLDAHELSIRVNGLDVVRHNLVPFLELGHPLPFRSRHLTVLFRSPGVLVGDIHGHV